MPAWIVRTSVIVLGVLTATCSVIPIANALMFDMARYTFVRPVFYAHDQGQDPYQVARQCMDEVMSAVVPNVVLFCACSLIGSIALTILAYRRTTSQHPAAANPHASDAIGGTSR